jgi:hypothetical protein
VSPSLLGQLCMIGSMQTVPPESGVLGLEFFNDSEVEKYLTAAQSCGAPRWDACPRRLSQVVLRKWTAAAVIVR